MVSSEISIEDAACELLRRRKARRSLLGFTKYTFPKYRSAPHHELIAEKLDLVLEGKLDRLMIFMPPRHGKSELASVRFPAYALGKYPDIQIACASYGGDLAKEFGRKVKEGVQDDKYQKLYPGVKLRQDSKAADRMNTAEGAYIALGVGGPFVGKGANIILIDDPLKGRAEADSPAERNRVIEWYKGVARNRLEPYEDKDGNRVHRGAMIVIQCMTGDTAVTMAGGTSTPLADIKPGDQVATYGDQYTTTPRLTGATVLNHASQGYDDCYAITTTSGIVLKANERHPFLVDDKGARKWTRVKDLTMGQEIVIAGPVRVNGLVRRALSRIVTKPLALAGSVYRTITSTGGPAGIAHPLVTGSHSDGHTSSTATALLKPNWTHYSANRMASALFAGGMSIRDLQNTGRHPFVSTIATVKDRFAPFFATIATSLSDAFITMQSTQKERRSTLDFTTDEIVSIEPVGCHEVFDIQVEGTENFIANGAVSHNTRWHEDDLAGYLLETKRADEWEVLELKAIENEGTDNEIALWPDRYPLEELHALRDDSGPREWSALFQQQPQPDDGTYFTRDMIKWYDPGDQPEGMHIYGASDYAVTDGGGDFTEHGILGIDEREDIYALDWWYGQTTADLWIDSKISLIEQYRPLVWVGESGVIKATVEPFMLKTMSERGIYQMMEWIAPVRDKPSRARSMQSRAARGKLHLPRHTPWAERLLAQMLVFPAGKHDDAVDVLSVFGLALDKTIGGKVAAPEKTVTKDRYDRAFEAAEDTGSNWKTA
ncbi:MAG: phage terminase large subunit [Desulfobacteraceae bacterium]|nr:phage terminase large subunit [Desulfobacteraceae bacterium]